MSDTIKEIKKYLKRLRFDSVYSFLDIGVDSSLLEIGQKIAELIDELPDKPNPMSDDFFKSKLLDYCQVQFEDEDGRLEYNRIANIKVNRLPEAEVVVEDIKVDAIEKTEPVETAKEQKSSKTGEGELVREELIEFGEEASKLQQSSLQEGDRTSIENEYDEVKEPGIIQDVSIDESVTKSDNGDKKPKDKNEVYQPKPKKLEPPKSIRKKRKKGRTSGGKGGNAEGLDGKSKKRKALYMGFMVLLAFCVGYFSFWLTNRLGRVTEDFEAPQDFGTINSKPVEDTEDRDAKQLGDIVVVPPELQDRRIPVVIEEVESAEIELADSDPNIVERIDKPGKQYITDELVELLETKLQKYSDYFEGSNTLQEAEEPKEEEPQATEEDLPVNLFSDASIESGLIELEAETYTLKSPLRLTKSLTIRGKGEDVSQIVFGSGGTAIYFKGGESASLKIENVSIKRNSDSPGNVVTVDSGELIVVGSSLQGGIKGGKYSGAGLILDYNAKANIRDSAINGNYVGVKLLNRSSTNIENTFIEWNEEFGLVAFGNSIISLQGNMIFSNSGYGVFCDNNSTISLYNNTIQDNMLHGMSFQGGCKGVAEGNDFYRNGYNYDNKGYGSGIEVGGLANVEIKNRNTVRNSAGPGILFAGHSSGIVENNRIQTNGVNYRVSALAQKIGVGGIVIGRVGVPDDNPIVRINNNTFGGNKGGSVSNSSESTEGNPDPVGLDISNSNQLDSVEDNPQDHIVADVPTPAENNLNVNSEAEVTSLADEAPAAANDVVLAATSSQDSRVADVPTTKESNPSQNKEAETNPLEIEAPAAANDVVPATTSPQDSKVAEVPTTTEERNPNINREAEIGSLANEAPVAVNDVVPDTTSPQDNRVAEVPPTVENNPNLSKEAEINTLENEAPVAVNDVNESNTDLKENDASSEIQALREVNRIIIPDINLQRIIKAELSIKDNETLTKKDLENLVELHSGFNNSTSDTEKIKSLEGLNYAVNLKELELDYNLIEDISPLTGLEKLEVVRLEHNHIENIFALSALTNLRSLYLNDNRIQSIGILLRLVKLRDMKLSNNQISDISVLSKLTQLETLGVAGNHLTNISVLSNLTKLSFLSIANNQIFDISSLSGLSSLRYLYIDHNIINDITSILRLPNLVELSLDNNQISDLSILDHNPLWIDDIKWISLENNCLDISINSYDSNNIKYLLEQNIRVTYKPQKLCINRTVNIIENQ